MIGSILQVNRRGKKKNLQGFKAGTLGLKWRHENKEKAGRGIFCFEEKKLQVQC